MALVLKAFAAVCCMFAVLPAGTLDGIIDTVSAEHDLNAVLALLAPRGQYVMVGLPPNKPTINHVAIVQKCLTMSGSAVGNAAMTQDMLNFCGEKGITADVEVGVQHLWNMQRYSARHCQKPGPGWSVRKAGLRVMAWPLLVGLVGDALYITNTPPAR